MQWPALRSIPSRDAERTSFTSKPLEEQRLASEAREWSGNDTAATMAGPDKSEPQAGAAWGREKNSCNVKDHMGLCFSCYAEKNRYYT